MQLDEGLARETLCAILKMQEDIEAVGPRLSELVARAQIA